MPTVLSYARGTELRRRAHARFARVSQRRIILVVFVVLTTFIATAAARSTARTASGRGAIDVPPEVAKNGDEWPLPGRDYANSRARTDSKINASNIDELEVAWSVPTPGSSAYGNLATVPVIAAGTVYVQDLQSNVRAIDLASGDVRWTHTYDRFQIGPNGPAIGYGNVYVAAGSKEIAALNLGTGEEQWSTRITATDSAGVSIQPTVVDGLVLAATIPISIDGLFKPGDRGILWALDAKTGKKVWTFDTIKSPDLWGHPEINSGGGAWYTPAVDLERGLVYWGIANPAPFPGTPKFPNGSSRPGPNLYTESVVALHVRTGKLAWYHQAVAHDLFDRDLVLAAIGKIATGTGTKEVVIGSGKPGRVLTLDPAKGKKLTDTPVGEHLNDDLTKLTKKVRVLPGLYGGVETPLATADGIAYAAAMNSPSDHEPDKENFLGGAPLGVMPGDVAAVDLATGKVLWSTKVDGDPLGGATVVGDLVLTGTFQGLLLGLNRRTGEIVWTETIPGGVNGQPAVTEDTIVWPIGIGKPPAVVAYRLPS